jgi:hypothetical protein
VALRVDSVEESDVGVGNVSLVPVDPSPVSCGDDVSVWLKTPAKTAKTTQMLFIELLKFHVTWFIYES